MRSVVIRALAGVLGTLLGSASLSSAQSSLEWSKDAFEAFSYRSGYGQVASDWTPWFEGANGEREWNIVPGESGWAQELRKSNVRLGLYRKVEGLEAGASYHIRFQARWLTGPGAAPAARLGIHPNAGTSVSEVLWSEPTIVSSRTSWTTVSADVMAPGPSVTLFLELDYRGLYDCGVAIDDLVIEPRTPPGNQPPAVSLHVDPAVTTAPGSFTLTASASDADGVVSKVEFFEGATLLGTRTGSPFSLVWSNVLEGSYSLTARAYDDEGASASSGPIVVTVGETPGVTDVDPGLIWVFDDFNSHDGSLVKRWSKWSRGSGEVEWRVVPGEGGSWAQEVRKSNVDVGLSRANRGFRPGDFYRLKFRAKKTTGTSAPKVLAGVEPEGGAIVWSSPVSVASSTSWVDVAYEFVATSFSERLYLRADLTGLYDTGVAFDNVSVELLSPREPEPWMFTGAPPVEPRNLQGIHDAGAEELFVEADRRGWVTEALAIGSDPNDESGKRFTEWIDGLGVICRIAHLYGQIFPNPGPAPAFPGLDAFAKRAANFVKSSTGCGIWSIGNEPHLEGVQDPVLYAEAFARTYRAIKAVRPGSKVITAGFVHGDLDYFRVALHEIEARGVVPDGIALHTYTDSQGWNEVSFSDYQKKIENLPESMRHLPLYITEAGTGGPGNPTNDTGLVDRMFDNVSRWNLSGGQQVRAVCLYRFTAGADKWSIEDNPGMRADFVRSLGRDYRWFPD